MLAVYASFSLRKRIGTKNWRRLHWTTYAIFAGATVHGVTAGTDMPSLGGAADLAAIGAVTFGMAWRAFAPPMPQPTRRTA